MTVAPLRLSEATLIEGAQELCARDADLALIVKQYGMPPLWVREAGFGSLIAIILEQQVSLASAKAAFDRLLTVITPLTPERFLTLDDATLKACGFSRQKTVYGRHLAETVRDGGLALEALEAMEDAAVHTALTSLKGIGHWSAEVYLMMALRRTDIWPKGDRALAVSVQRVKRLPACPTPDELEQIGAGWRPWRSVAAHLLWHDYLSRRTPVPQETPCPDRTA